MRNGLIIYDTEWCWYKDDKLHRESGPAIIHKNSDSKVVEWEEWYYNGVRHRLDGPAVILYNINYNVGIYGKILNKNTWFYNNKMINCSTQEEFDKLIKMKVFW